MRVDRRKLSVPLTIFTYYAIKFALKSVLDVNVSIETVELCSPALLRQSYTKVSTELSRKDYVFTKVTKAIPANSTQRRKQKLKCKIY